jgi:hypothetical protein
MISNREAQTFPLAIALALVREHRAAYDHHWQLDRESDRPVIEYDNCAPT